MSISVNERLITAVQDLAPCYPWEAYEGSGDPKLARYFVFNYGTMAKDFGDNAPPFERYLIQLHYFCPSGENSLAVRKSAKRAVFDAGFTWPTEINATDEDGQHYVFEFERLEAT